MTGPAEVETFGQVTDRDSVIWTQYAYGIWKHGNLPEGVHRISAAGFKTIERQYGPLTWIKEGES